MGVIGCFLYFCIGCLKNPDRHEVPVSSLNFSEAWNCLVDVKRVVSFAEVLIVANEIQGGISRLIFKIPMFRATIGY